MDSLTMHDAMMTWIETGNPLDVSSAGTLVLIFFVASFIFVPRTLLCLGVGALVGWPSVLIILPSTTLGGVLAFLAARYLLKNRLQAMIGARPRLRKIAAAVDEEGWRIVALLRFASPLPNALQNYLFGLTRIGVVPFAVATFVFTIPQVVLYVFLGSAGRAILDDNMSTLNRTLLGIGAISVAAVALLLVRRVRRNELSTSTPAAN
jgi:uncharacterized membrane protein YdjX (TVP38/TMEM64 family)